MRRLLADRDARFYLGGQALSTVGDNALWLAMGIWVKILTGSSAAAGLVVFALTAGLLLAPVTGLVADRLRRRPLLIAANLAAAAGVCVLLAVHGRGQVWLIYPVMFGYGALNGLITSAQTALLAVMLPAELLGEASSVLQMAAMGLRVISPLLGAGLLAWAGPVPVVLFDAGTFVLAAGAVAALRVREPARAPAGARWRAEATAGIRYIRRTPALRRLPSARPWWRPLTTYRLLLAAMAVAIVVSAAYLAAEPGSGKAAAGGRAGLAAEAEAVAVAPALVPERADNEGQPGRE